MLSYYEKLVKDCRGDRKEGKYGMKDMFTKLKYPMFLGMCLGIYMQLSGINAIVYYSNDIFKNIGSD